MNTLDLVLLIVAVLVSMLNVGVAFLCRGDARRAHASAVYAAKMATMAGGAGLSRQAERQAEEHARRKLGPELWGSQDGPTHAP